MQMTCVSNRLRRRTWLVAMAFGIHCAAMGCGFPFGGFIPEVELAFITMFHTFGDSFFNAYSAARPIAEGFAEQRCHLYNLYPYLVHTRLFGGSYLQSVDRILGMFNC